MKIGVLGAGTMGNGIAHVFAQYNYKVVLVDVNNQILSNAFNSIEKNLNRQCQKNIINNKDLKNSLSNIELSTEINSFKSCDLVIEAIKEDLDLKKKIFSQLDLICDKNTILASNTSSISINSLADSTNRSEKVIGMHFMNPVPIMKLVEIIKGNKTSKETIDIILSVSKKLDKIPIQCNDSPGFVSNRILMPMINEAAHCYNEGVADAQSIDSIMKLGMGHPMGPLKLADLIGIDVCVYILNVLFNEFNDVKYKPSDILVNMLEKKYLGKKTGKGFYNYEL
jgi:3-hydroxybutyryl-CoA dehydrogenase